MPTLKGRQKKARILSLVFSAGELALLRTAAGQYQQFSEWLRGLAIARAQNGNPAPAPGPRRGPRLHIKKIRISKNQETLFRKAARTHNLTIQAWLRDLAVETATGAPA